MTRNNLFKKLGTMVWILLGWMWLGVFSYSQTASPKDSVQSSDPMYVIQPDDSLEIFVWKEPDLTRKVLVRPDGNISFPLIQDLKAAGSSPSQLKLQIEKKLKDYLKEPNVTVIVDNIRSYKIFVVGKVQKPGSLSSEKPISVLQALSLAGGFQDFAKKSDITILRKSSGQNFVLPFDYPNVIRGRKQDENIVLQSGDVVVVP
jgi:polysaccharide export outer membrane protein